MRFRIFDLTSWKKAFPRFSLEQFFCIFNNEIPSSKPRRASYFVFKVTLRFSFPILLVLIRDGRQNQWPSAPNAKKKTFDCQTMTRTSKNGRLKAFVWRNIEFVSFKNSNNSKIRITLIKISSWDRKICSIYMIFRIIWVRIIGVFFFLVRFSR